MIRDLITSESVTEGHPDKVCDQISDAILDDLLRQDPYSRAAVETMVTTGSVHIAGEVTTNGYCDSQKVARNVLKEIGYTDPCFGIDYEDVGALQLWGNLSATWHANQTNTTAANDSFWNVTVTGIADGTYVWGVYCNDSAGNEDWTNTNRTLTVDASGPSITLLSPSDATSSTIDYYNFTFNVTDDQSISNCSLIFDGSVYQVLTNVNNTGGTVGMVNSTLSVATHTWSVNCTDNFGTTDNSSSRTLTVTSAPTTTGGSSGGGGAVGWTYFIDKNQLDSGYTKDLSSSDRIKFLVDSKTHYVKIMDVTSNTVKIEVASDNPQTATFLLGDTRTFEVTGDSVYDLTVKLDNIGSEKAVLIVQSTDAAVTEETIALEQAKENAALGINEEDIEEELAAEKGEVSLPWIWIITGIIILVVVIVVLSSIKSKK